MPPNAISISGDEKMKPVTITCNDKKLEGKIEFILKSLIQDDMQ